MDIDFTAGFSSITGETGTGKSIILDAINFCFGKFPSKEIRKNLGKACYVEIQFDNLKVKKILENSGKCSCFINEHKVSSKELKEIFPDLIDITAQSDSILSKASQRELLDDFLKAMDGSVSAKLKLISQLFYEISKLDAEIATLEEEERIAKRDHTYYSMALKELEAIDIKLGEETELLEKRVNLAKLCSSDELVKAVVELLHSSSLSSSLSQSIKNLERVNSDLTDNIKSRLESISIDLSDVIAELDAISNDSSSREIELNQIDERLSEIRSVARKLNVPANTLFEFLEEARRKISLLEDFDIKLQNLTAQQNQLIFQYKTVANELHVARQEAAQKLSRDVCDKLSELLMPNASFTIEVQQNEFARSQYGTDDVEFLANFNANSRLRPLSQIASGGEAARLNFALKTLLGIKGKFETLIFDEVDIGIGGAAAFAMGSAMRTLAQNCQVQVIAITHSPQVASRADSHILVKKSIQDSSVQVAATPLSPLDRVQEIARMISGESVTPDALQAARQLLV